MSEKTPFDIAREALKQTGLGDDVLQEILAGLRGDHGSGL